MPLDFDYQAARKAGYSDDDILDGLKQRGMLDFDLDAARKAGYSSTDIMSSLASEPIEQTKPPSRNAFAVANDTVIELANAVVGGLAAVGDFASPGNRASKAMKEFVREGEEKQSDVTKANKQTFRDELAKSETISDDLSAVGGYIKENPLLTAAQAVGSFVGPGLAVKGTSLAAGALGATAKGATLAGRGAGVAVGAAMGGGDAAGDAYELAQQISDDVLLNNREVQELLASGKSMQEVRDEIGTIAARKASVLPAIAGGVAGAFGAERLLAGGAGRAGAIGAAKAGLVEGAGEAVEEGLAQFEGRRAVQEYDPSIDPTKNVAAMAAMGGVMGFGSGAGLNAVSPNQQAAVPVEPEVEQGQPAIGNEQTNITEADSLLGAVNPYDVGGYVSASESGQDTAIDQPQRSLFGGGGDVSVPDIMSSTSVDEAIAKAAAVIDSPTEADIELKNRQIDEAFNQYRAQIQAQQQAEFDLAEEQRRAQEVEQAAILTEAQGFDTQEPTAMQLAMQEAQERRARLLTPVSQRTEIAPPATDMQAVEPIQEVPNVSESPTPVLPSVVDTSGSNLPTSDVQDSQQVGSTGIVEQLAGRPADIGAVAAQPAIDVPATDGSLVEQPALDRRVSIWDRRNVRDMTPDEMKLALRTSPVTGLPNKVAFEEDVEANPNHNILYGDLDDFKNMNDRYGLPGADQILKAVGSIKADLAQKMGVAAYHRSGDEFMASHPESAKLEAYGKALQQELADTQFKITMADGSVVTHRGVGLSYGTGQNYDAAASRTKQQKELRKSQGLRRGDRGLVPEASERGTVDQYSATGRSGDISGSTSQEVAIALIQSSDLSKVERINLKAALRRGDISPEDIASELSQPDATVSAPDTTVSEPVTPETKPLKSTAPKTSGLKSSDVESAVAPLRKKWQGFDGLTVVQSLDELPANLRDQADESTEGLYDPASGKVHIISDNVKSPDRAAWIAAHEIIGHAGLRKLKDQTVDSAVKYASANRFVKDLATAIGKDRGTEIEIEEAIAELSAATETDDFTALETRYGVKVPESAKNGIRASVARVIQAVKRFFANLTGLSVDEVSDAEIRELISKLRKAVEYRDAKPNEVRYEDDEIRQRTPSGSVTRIPADVRGTAAGRAGSRNSPESLTGKQSNNVRVVRPTEGAESLARTGDVAENLALQSRAPSSQQQTTERVPKWAENLTDEQKAALRKSGAIYSDKTLKQRINELREGAAKKLQYGIFDQFGAIKDQLGKTPYMLARMAKAADGTLEAMMLYGQPQLDRDGAVTVDTTKKGFVEVMHSLNGEHDRFFSWLAGRRAAELKKEGRENLFTDDDISSLSTLNRGKMEDGSSREMAYLKAQQAVAELNKSVLDIAQESGIIDGGSRQLWKSDFYVPFYRVMEEGKVGPSIKSGLVNQKTIKQLKGGTANLGDLTQNMLMNWSTLLTASAKNRAAKSALSKATSIGAATEADEATIRQMGKAIGTKAVSVLDEGVYRWYVVEDEQLLAAISALEFNGYNNDAMKVMGKFKNYLTFAVTAMPTFKARNLMRDSVSAIAVSDLGYNPIANVKKGVSLIRNEDFRAQMIAGGGIFRFGSLMEGNRAAHVKKLIDSGVDNATILDTPSKMKAFLQKLWDGYQNIGDIGENVNRAVLYEKLRKEGKSHLEASFEARDLMDFGLSGAWAGVRALNQVLPFFNARLQGLYKLGRGYNDDPRRMGYVVGAVALASVALMLAYADDDDFKKRTDADRNNYWWFKVGETAYRIPKPFEVGAMGTAVEHFTALWLDSENTDAKRFRSQMGDLISGQLAMNPIPQIFRPMLDVYANKEGFSGRPIETMAMQRLRPEDRYTANTSELARLLGKAGLFDPVSLVSGQGYKQLSPVQIDSMIRGYFAGLGTLTTTATDALLHNTIVDRGETLPVPLKTMTGSLIEDLPSNSSRYLDMLYSTAKQVEQSYASYRDALKSGDYEKAKGILEEDPRLIGKYHLIGNIKKNESRIGQRIKQIIDSKDYTSEQKETMVRALKQEQDKLARRLATYT